MINQLGLDDHVDEEAHEVAAVVIQQLPLACHGDGRVQRVNLEKENCNQLPSKPPRDAGVTDQKRADGMREQLGYKQGRKEKVVRGGA